MCKHDVSSSFRNQAAWVDIKKKLIEEKLEKLGVEKGTGSAPPHIHAPHARAASVSHLTVALYDTAQFQYVPDILSG